VLLRSALSVLAIAGSAVVATAIRSAEGEPARAQASDSKLAKEAVAIETRGAIVARSAECCGYPLAPELGFALRYYWLASQDDFDDPDETSFAPVDGVDLYTRDGYLIGSFSEKFAWSLRMEGSGVLSDGRVINTAGACEFGYGTCFETLDPEHHPYGRGAGQRPLLPFKSVAVDPTVISIGEPLYIPEFDGMRLPDGSVHDGCVRADDTGGGIKKQKMDFFVVTYRSFRFLLNELWGVSWVTPHVEAPRCRYLQPR
jgi:3D (Asp-Asp-Asp) domain-containing protein